MFVRPRVFGTFVVYYKGQIYCTLLTAIRPNTTRCYTSLQFTMVHYITQQCILVHYIRLHCPVVHYTTMHCCALQYTALYCGALPCTALYYGALQCTALYCVALQYIANRLMTGEGRDGGGCVALWSFSLVLGGTSETLHCSGSLYSLQWTLFLLYTVPGTICALYSVQCLYYCRILCNVLTVHCTLCSLFNVHCITMTAQIVQINTLYG